jgi:hypothetical protein
MQEKAVRKPGKYLVLKQVGGIASVVGKRREGERERERGGEVTNGNK